MELYSVCLFVFGFFSFLISPATSFKLSCLNVFHCLLWDKNNGSCEAGEWEGNVWIVPFLVGGKAIEKREVKEKG